MATGTIETDESAVDSENGALYSRELAIKIDDLVLSVRARNVLKNAGIEYVGDLVQLTDDGLLSLPNCGRVTVQELRDRLAELGLCFGMILDQWNRPISGEPSSAFDTR